MGNSLSLDRSSALHNQPTATPDALVARIDGLRRSHQWSATRIDFELTQAGTPVSRRTVSRHLAHLAHLGLNRRRFIDPNGDSTHEPRRIVADGLVTWCTLT